MSHPTIIQGGMGAAVSNWRLANAVARTGHMGVVSAIGINLIMTRRLQDGDAGGHIRRALLHFPDQPLVQKILKQYFIEGGRPAGTPYRQIAAPSLKPALYHQQLSAVGAFVEIWLAKEGHQGPVGVNYLEKLQISNLPSIYGAMLAGVDYVLIGAGIPRDIPGVLDHFSRQERGSTKVQTGGPAPAEEVLATFDPLEAFPQLRSTVIKRPAFLGIVSSATLATHLARKSTGSVEGFIIEGPTAGGHNAPPRGPLKLNELGEPVYGPKDIADLEAIRGLGLPFWLAGSYGRPEKLKEALSLGATGVQVGTAFAFCEESGLTDAIKTQVISLWGPDAKTRPPAVFTDPVASPTDFPFKVLPLAGTLSEKAVYEARKRICDLGFLRQAVVLPNGDITLRCAAEPPSDFVKKGGRVEDTAGRKCLCNALMANIGLGQIQSGAYQEAPLLTAGDDMDVLKLIVKPGQTSYKASDVLAFLTNSPL